MKASIQRFGKVFANYLRLSIILILFVSGIEAVEAQDESRNLAAHKCGVFKVPLTYAEAINCGDVLILERQFYDGVRSDLQKDGTKLLSGGTLSRVIIWRVRFDQGGERALVAVRSKSDWLELDKVASPSQGRTVRVEESGYILDRKNRKFSIKQKAKLVELGWMDNFKIYNDPRVAGMGGTTFGAFVEAKEAFNSMATGDTLIDSKESKKFFELRVNFYRNEISKANCVRHFYFDKRINLPVKSLSYHEFDAGGRTDPEESHFEWKEMSGIYVPIRVKAEACRSYIGPLGEPLHGDHSTEINLHWISINEPLPKDAFEKSNLTKSRKFAELTDPVKNDATSIIKVLEEEAKETGHPEEK